MTNIEGSWVVHIRFIRGEATHSMLVEQEGGGWDATAAVRGAPH